MNSSHEVPTLRSPAFLTAVASALWLLTGCVSGPDRSHPFVIPDEQFRSYDERLAAQTKLLGECRAAPVPVEVRQRQHVAIRRFTQTLEEYTTAIGAIAELGSEEDEFQALERVKGSLDRCRSLRQSLADLATEATLAADEAETHFERLELRPEDAPPVAGIEDYPRYLASARRLSEILGEVDAYLTSTHLRAVSEASTQNEGQATTVHCVILSEMPAVDLRPHLAEYHRAWKTWYRRALRGGSLDGAIAVYSFIAKQTTPLAPDSVRELLELAHANFEYLPSLEVLEHVLASVREIEGSFERSEAPSGWEHARDVLRSSILLSLASHESDLATRVDIATKAFELSREFSAETAKVFAEAALEFGREAIAEHRYVDAVVGFEDILGKGPGADLKYNVSRFRSEIVAAGLKDARVFVNTYRMDEAGEAFEELSMLASKGEERSRLGEERYRFYHLGIDHYLKTDPERALALGREALERNPGNAEFRRKTDQALIAQLRTRLGNLAESYQTHGPKNIRQLVREAVAATTTSSGMAACESFLKEIENAWIARSTKEPDPEKRFLLARASAQLVGRSKTQAQTRGSVALVKAVEASRAAEDWSSVEAAITAAYKHCPEIQRPESFQAAFRDLIRTRHDAGDRAGLLAHLARYTLTYRRDLRDVDDLLAEYAKPESELGRGLYHVLRDVAPLHGVVRNFETTDTELSEEKRPETVAVLPVEELANVTNWWRQPPPLEAPSYNLTKENTSTAAEVAEISAALPTLKIAAWSFFSASVLGVIAAFVATIRGGVLRFEYYAIVSTLFGSAGGFLLGII